jgi:two-component system, LytTR family, sensor kinase
MGTAKKNITTGWLFSNRDAFFWKKAILVYCLSEIVYWIIYYISFYLQECDNCLLPVSHYISLCLLNILSTYLVWQALYRFSGNKIATNILLNILLFIFHQAGWFFIIYDLSKAESAVWNRKIGYSDNSLGFAAGQQIVGIWFDTAKYLIKVIVFYCLKSFVDFKRAERQKVKLILLNKDLQLNLLKQQLNPHFYFNTMNNLYGLSRKASPKLYPAFNQLSGIMQYVLKECTAEKVALEKEINFLRNYVELEKLRYETDTVIAFEVQGELCGKKIASLLLIQFVENAFKHGMKEKTAHNWMKVFLSVNETVLHFILENSCYSDSIQEGFGLSSSRKRLELLYKDRHHLETGIKNNIFIVNLTIELV